jgi:alpha(1,3/1,4) fucosyltransferase
MLLLVQNKIKTLYIISIFLLLSSLNFNLYSATVYVISLSFPNNETQFDEHSRDGCMLPFIALREALQTAGYHCTVLSPSFKENELDKDRWFIALEVPLDKKIVKLLQESPPERSILLMFEPPAVLPHNYNLKLHTPFKMVFTLMHEMVDNIRYFPLYFPQPYLFVAENPVPYRKRKLCTLIASDKNYTHPFELYSHRRKIIHFFEKHARKKFDFYGVGWDYNKHRCYIGSIAHKLPYLQNYKFAICYENMITKTYITEKIFDCMHAGCIPIYWGAEQISSFIPHNAYIKRENFKSDRALYRFINSMSRTDQGNYLKAAHDFFNSKEAAKFSIQSFVETILIALFG